MAELNLGYNPYYYYSNYKVYNGLESSKRVNNADEQDFCAMAWNPASYANKSDANIVTGIKISYRRKYSKDSAAISGKVRFTFYPRVIASPSVSGNQISGEYGSLSANTQSVDFNNTSWSGVETKTLATDAVTLQLGGIRQNNYYLAVFCKIKRMSGTLGHTGYIKGFSGTLVYTPRYYARFRNNDGSIIESIRAITCNSGEVPTSPTPPDKDGYTFKGWTRTQGGTVAEPLVAGHDEDIYWYAVYEKNTYAITASAGAGGTVSGGGTFEHGATVTIKATPDIGYRFVKWAEDGNTSASRTVTVSGNATYTAVFEAIIYTIKYVDNSGTSIVSASFGQEISARAISDKNITITYNETSSRGKTETYKFPVRGWKDSNSIVAKDGKTYTIDVFDAPFYANKHSDLYNVFGYNKYGLINHYIDYGLSEGRQCKPNSSEPCGVYLQDRTINSLSTTHGQQVVLEAVYEDRVLVTIGDISKSGYIFKGWQSPEHTELLQPGTQVYFTDSATLTAVWEAVDTPPEFTSESLTYAGAQVSAENKVPAGESCILSVGVS